MTIKNTSTSTSDSEIEIISSKNQKQEPIHTLTSSPSSFHSNSTSNQINKPIQTTNSHSNNRSTSILIESSDEEKTEFNKKTSIDTPNPIHFDSFNQTLNSNKSHSNLEISRKDDKGKFKVIELSDTDEDLNQSHHHSHINQDHHDELPTPDDLFSQDSSLIQPTSVSQPLPSFQSTSNFNLRVKSKRKSKSDDSKKRTKQIEKSNQREQVRIEREVKRATKAKEKHEAKEMREVNKLIGRQEAIVEIRLKVPSSILQIKSHPLTKSIEIFKTRIINEGNETKMLNPILDDDEEELIRWIRICKKEWNEVLNCFEPCLSKEVLEKSVLLIWNAQEIDDWIHEGNGEFLRRAKSIREERPMDQIFIVIYGLENLMKTIKNHQNSKMKDQIGSELRGEEDQIGWESNHQQKKKKPIGPKNSMDQILREIEMIKILTKCFIIKVEDTNQLSNWLWELTFEIAVRPYKAKKQKLKADLNLEIEGNKGKDLEDTYLKMLTCLSRVTENEAKGILENFPTLNRLYSSWDSFMAKGDLSGAEGMLIGCKKANSSKSIGKITSKKIFDVLYASKDGDTCIHNT